MFSKTCEYSLRALIFIAQQSIKGIRVGKKEVAIGIDSPEYFTAKILQQLSKKGLVKSIKGPNGGFYMDEHELNITLAQIIFEIDGDSLFTNCGMGLKECSEARPCPIHNDLKEIKHKIKTMLENYKIKMFIEELDFNTTFLK